MNDGPDQQGQTAHACLLAVMNGDRPTEATALLNRVRSPDVDTVPSISPTLAHVSALDVQHITPDDLCPHDLADAPSEVRLAYTLIVLLQLRQDRLHNQPRTNNLWELWKELEENARDVDLLDAHIASTWNLFLNDYHTAVEIEDALWIGFPADQSVNSRNLRVIDFLHLHDGPRSLVAHRLVQLSLLRRWRHGAFPEDTFASISLRILVDRFDNLGTPRIYHFVENMCQASYLSLLAWYLLYPPIVAMIGGPTLAPNYGVREIFLMLLSLSLAIRSWSSSVPPLIVFCAYTFSLPATPIPGTIAFTFLNLAFALHIYQLHLPVPSSPLFFFRPDAVLPLATLFSRATTRVLWPSFQYFLPAFLVMFVLLSQSLLDTFSLLHIGDFILPPSTPSFIPPAETRGAFLLMLMLVLVLYLSSLALLIVALPSDCPSHTIDKWDRFSKPVGLEARRAFIFATSYYSDPYTYPTPLNLLCLIFVHIPALVARVVRVDSSCVANWNKILWRISVGPLVVIFSLISWTLSHT